MTQVPAYDPQLVEAKWQERWAREHTNEPDLHRARRPFYNLMMFPYPSAEGLHVGNMFAFTGADIYGRFKRLQGHDVFEPIGFDPFTAAQLDRTQRGRGADFRDPGRREDPRVHDPSRHRVRRHLPRARPRAPAGGPAHGRRAAAPGERLPA